MGRSRSRSTPLRRCHLRRSSNTQRRLLTGREVDVTSSTSSSEECPGYDTTRRKSPSQFDELTSRFLSFRSLCFLDSHQKRIPRELFPLLVISCCDTSTTGYRLSEAVLLQSAQDARMICRWIWVDASSHIVPTSTRRKRLLVVAVVEFFPNQTYLAFRVVHFSAISAWSCHHARSDSKGFPVWPQVMCFVSSFPQSIGFQRFFVLSESHRRSSGLHTLDGNFVISSLGASPPVGQRASGFRASRERVTLAE